MKIEVFGPGCARCLATEKNVREALKQFGCDAEVVHIRDVKEFARCGVSFTPAVVIDGRLKVSGRVPTVLEIVTWLADTLQANQPERA